MIAAYQESPTMLRRLCCSAALLYVLWALPSEPARVEAPPVPSPFGRAAESVRRWLGGAA